MLILHLLATYSRLFFVSPNASILGLTYRSVIHISKGIAKKVIPANGKVANVAATQTHRPDINPENTIRIYQPEQRSKELTIDELVLGYFIPSVPDGSSLLKVVDRVCSRQEHGDPQKEAGDRQEEEEKRPCQAN